MKIGYQTQTYLISTINIICESARTRDRDPRERHTHTAKEAGTWMSSTNLNSNVKRFRYKLLFCFFFASSALLWTSLINLFARRDSLMECFFALIAIAQFEDERICILCHCCCCWPIYEDCSELSGFNRFEMKEFHSSNNSVQSSVTIFATLFEFFLIFGNTWTTCVWII